jgi:hypothetical protein
VHTVAELRTAVAEILRNHDLGVVSAVMRVPLSTVRRVSRCPEQVDLPTFQRFLRACGAEPAEIEAWTAAREVVLATPRRQNPHLPSPESIGTPEQMRDAIEAMLGAATVDAVAVRLRVPRSAVMQVFGGPDRVTAETFRDFVLACGVRPADASRWIDARQRVIEAQARHEIVPTPMVTAGSGSPSVAAPTPAPARNLPDPSKVDTYETLLCALGTLLAAVELTLPELEESSGGRLCAGRLAAILDGVSAATAEEFVLLLRGCGLRGEVAQWVDAWLRLDGATRGIPRRIVRSRRTRLPVLRISSTSYVLAFLVLLGLLAWLI